MLENKEFPFKPNQAFELQRVLYVNISEINYVYSEAPFSPDFKKIFQCVCELYLFIKISTSASNYRELKLRNMLHEEVSGIC